MRIAIITFHRAYNCGAMLQAWALKTILERMGHIVEFPILNHVGEVPRWRIPLVNPYKKGLSWIKSLIGRSWINILSFPNEDMLRFRYSQFRKHYIPERKCSIDDLIDHYDEIIVGSDQVWSDELTKGYAPIFFGDALPKNLRKIAYAASYGDLPLDGSRFDRVRGALKNFDAVSVRERLASEQLREAYGQQVRENIDPTLLLRAEDYSQIVGRVAVPKEPYLFMYTLSTAPFFVETAKELARRLKVRCIIAPCYQYTRYHAPQGLTYGISPDRLVAYAKNAKYVLAGSFHGTVMGVVFKNPFLSLRGQVDEYESRPAALLRKIGCANRLVNPAMSVDEINERLSLPLPIEVYEKLDALRVQSLNWLKDNI